MSLPAAAVQIDVSQDADWIDQARVLVRDPQGALAMLCRDANRRLVEVPARPFDLTGCALEMLIAPSLDFSTPIARLASYDVRRIVIQDAAAGIIAFAVPAAVLATWPCGTWAHVLRVTAGAAAADIWRGPFNLFPTSSF